MEDNNKLDIHYSESIKETLKKLEDYFSKEENVKQFLEYCEQESKKDVWTHLHCEECCDHRQPRDCKMGTICWCEKYLVGQEELCDKECGKRWTYDIGIYEEE